jgi:DNA-binding NtrC family response regulator
MFRIVALTSSDEAFKALKPDRISGLEVKLYRQALPFIEALISMKCNLAVLDVDLLKKETGTMLNIIQKYDKNIPMVLFTSPEDFRHYAEEIMLCGSNYLTKPISPESFELFVEAILQKSNKSNLADANS